MKKDETRFSIRFNLADPRHRKAKEILEASGRRKASFIADAVWEYVARYGENPAAIVPVIATAPNPAIPHIKSDSAEVSSDEEMRQTILDGLTAFTS